VARALAGTKDEDYGWQAPLPKNRFLSGNRLAARAIQRLSCLP
jgi:hypothetical protein